MAWRDRRSQRVAAAPAIALFAALLLIGLTQAAEEQRVRLPVSVNQVPKGDALVILRDRDILIRLRDLQSIGLYGIQGARETEADETFVSLASLAPEARFAFDLDAVTLDLTVPPAWLGINLIDLGPSRPDGIVYSKDTSAFFNYAFNGRDSGTDSGIQDSRTYDAFGEAGLSVGGNLFYSSVSRTTEGDLFRGLTNYTVDDRQNLLRWVVGDSLATAGGLGGALFMGGFSVSRNFDLDPYYIRTPSLSLSGAVTTPSTVNVYVNGSIVRQEQIPPGTFDLTHLTVPSGSGTAQVVIRDAFGNTQTLTNPFYSAPTALETGVSQYSYNVGFRREHLESQGNDYGPPFLLGTYRIGWNDYLTPGGRLEADQNVVSGSYGVTVRLPGGEMEGSLAGSRDAGRIGKAGSLVYRWLGRRWNFGVLARALSADYATLSLRAIQDRPLLETHAFTGLQILPRTGLTLQYGSADMRDTADTSRVSLGANLSIARQLSLYVTGGRAARGPERSNELFFGVSYYLGRGTIASVSREWQASGDSTSLDVQKSLPLGTGYGYRANLFKGEDRAGGNGAFQYQGPFGRYEARLDSVGGEEVKTLSVSGGLVAIGGTFAATRAVGQSFALIRVPGVKGVTGLSSNQPIARSNRRGDILVPDLMPYYGNRLGIIDQDLSLAYRIETTEKVVAPPYRGGALVTFPVQRMRSVRGLLVMGVHGQEATPALGVLTVTMGRARFTSPIGTHGEFELENVPAGRGRAWIESRAGGCSFTINVPAFDRPIVDLGTLRCTATEAP